MNVFKRLLVVGVILMPFLIFIPIAVHQTQPYIPKALQKMLVQEGRFYNSAEDRYRISDVDFGKGLSETVAALGLKGYLQRERLMLFKILMMMKATT